MSARTQAADLLDSYWREPGLRRPVYVVRDGRDGAIVDWSTSRRQAERSPKSWQPVVERMTGPVLL